MPLAEGGIIDFVSALMVLIFIMTSILMVITRHLTAQP